jgi:hypothetical protein
MTSSGSEQLQSHHRQQQGNVPLQLWGSQPPANDPHRSITFDPHRSITFDPVACFHGLTYFCRAMVNLGQTSPTFHVEGLSPTRVQLSSPTHSPVTPAFKALVIAKTELFESFTKEQKALRNAVDEARRSLHHARRQGPISHDSILYIENKTRYDRYFDSIRSRGDPGQIALFNAYQQAKFLAFPGSRPVDIMTL